MASFHPTEEQERVEKLREANVVTLILPEEYDALEEENVHYREALERFEPWMVEWQVVQLVE